MFKQCFLNYVLEERNNHRIIQKSFKLYLELLFWSLWMCVTSLEQQDTFVKVSQ